MRSCQGTLQGSKVHYVDTCPPLVSGGLVGQGPYTPKPLPKPLRNGQKSPKSTIFGSGLSSRIDTAFVALKTYLSPYLSLYENCVGRKGGLLALMSLRYLPKSMSWGLPGPQPGGVPLGKTLQNPPKPEQSNEARPKVQSPQNPCF